MVHIAGQRAEYNIILSLPGVGPNTAIRLMAEIGDITRFTSNKQLNAFAGIDIRRFQSGKTFLKIKSINVEVNICGSSCSSSSRT